jgi:hypothetical protein
MEKVAERLVRITSALEKASVPYALVGGQAVALWVATKDPSAVRTTKDVDRRAMLGPYVGKSGVKTKTPSPESRKASQKNCSKIFAPGPTTTFVADTSMPNSFQ